MNAATAPQGELVKALAAAELEFPAITPDAVNPHFGSRYVTLGAIIAATRPALARHGLVVTQSLMPDVAGENFTRTLLVTTLLHVSGESLQSTIVLPPFKGPQDAGSLLTYLRRYTLSGLLNIASEQDDDANSAQNESSRAQTRAGHRGGREVAQRRNGPLARSQRDSEALRNSTGIDGTADDLAVQLADAIDIAPSVGALDSLVPSLSALPAELRPPLRVRFSERRKALEEIARDQRELDELDGRNDP